jgi:hypothetical protein
MIGRGNRSTRRTPAPVPLCPPQTPHAARARTRAAAVGSQRLTAWATARPITIFMGGGVQTPKILGAIKYRWLFRVSGSAEVEFFEETNLGSLFWRGFLEVADRRLSVGFYKHVYKKFLLVCFKNLARLTPRSSLIFHTLIFVQLRKKFLAFMDPKSYTRFKREHYWTLSWARWMKHKYSVYLSKLHLHIIVPFTRSFPFRFKD